MHKEYHDIIDIVKKTNRDAWKKGFMKGLEKSYGRTWMTDDPSEFNIPEDAKILICYADAYGTKVNVDIATWHKAKSFFSLLNYPSTLIVNRRILGWSLLPSTQQFEDFLLMKMEAKVNEFF